MNKTLLALVAASGIALVGCKKEAEAPAEVTLDTLEQKVSYSIGVNLAQNINVDQFDFNTDAFAMAVEDIKAGKEPRLTMEEMMATMQTFSTLQRELAMEAQKKAADENLAKGQAFLAEKESEDGVVKTDSGLMYKVITEGSGDKPSAADSVVAHYRGTLLDGTEFDSSYSRGQPATFGVSNLIPGWIEALQLMPAGSKWELYIPADLAYGERGNGSIPPNSTLIFELELLEIVGDENAEQTAESEEKAEG
ncbi:FKBP-type peptidyl-prolyl cis-trans isomerase [Agaribacterium haliotis]|uniref:FKBP-type peptidyl-prolyl cis-trans isomerase n=1 Tax=Agaribacterium haliotis TaxID=2013869 RepID=UPI000BB55BB6|nr:FKBP-type peptidyl-prolyl cis-trans isomerase [Agaribacterium haliotis]